MLVKKNKRKISRKKSNNKKPNKGKSKKRVTIKPKKRRVIKKGGYKSRRKKPTRKKKKKLMRGGDPVNVLHNPDFPYEWKSKVPNLAFSGRYEVVRVHIPDGIVEIGEGAFMNCEKLNRVSLPKSIQTIGKKAFYGCSKLSYVDWPGYVKVEEAAFANCPKLKTIINIEHFPDEWKGIVPDEAFYGRHDVIGVVIPRSITSIRSHAFGNCKNLDWVRFEFETEEYTSTNELIKKLRDKYIHFIRDPFHASLPEIIR